MALELSGLDMELLLSFSTPVDTKDVAVPATTINQTPLASQQAHTETKHPGQQVASPPTTSGQSTPTSPNSATKVTINITTKPIVEAAPSSSNSAAPENSKVIHAELTDKGGATYQTSYLAEVVFTRDDFNKKKDNTEKRV